MKKIMAALLALALGCAFSLVAQHKGVQAATGDSAGNAATGVTAPTGPAVSAGESVAQAAMKKASDAQKYLYLFIAGNDSEETATARRAVEAAVAKLADKADAAFINKDSAAEKGIIEKLRLAGAPMPIVLAMAPNGAITGAYFAEKLKDPQLQDSIAGAGEQQCMKALQENKLVFLCVQNDATKSNDAAMQGVNEFKADARFSEVTEIVKVNPASAPDQGLLAKLKVDPAVTEATTVFVVPPGSLVSKVEGATSKDALVSALTAATSGGCGGGKCGPGACGPKK